MGIAMVWKRCLRGGRLLAMAAWGMAVGCGPADSDLPRTTVVDSAGTRIVTSVSDGIEFATASLDSGVALAVEGDPAKTYFRVGGILGLPEGRIVVGDGGSKDLRFFDARGNLLRVVGGDGSGPGEFKAVSSLHHLRGDSIGVVDSRARRISVFDWLGNFGRTIQSMPPAAAGTPPGLCINPSPRAIYESGDQLQLGWSCLPSGVGKGFTAYEADLLRWDIASETATRLTKVPVVGVYVTGPGGPNDVVFPPFPTITSLAVHGPRVYVSDGGAFEVSVYGPSGERTEIFRLARDPVPLPAEAEQRYRAEAAQNGQEIQSPFPTYLPAYDRLVIDDAGRVWARQYAPFPEGPQRWDLFGAEGMFLGGVSMPLGFTLFDVRGNTGFGVGKDSLDVERPMVVNLDVAQRPHE